MVEGEVRVGEDRELELGCGAVRWGSGGGVEGGVGEWGVRYGAFVLGWRGNKGRGVGRGGGGWSFEALGSEGS